MFNKLTLLKGIVISSTAGMLFFFTNCAPPSSFQSESMSFNSLSGGAPVVHEDSDQTIPGEGKVVLETTYEPILVDREYLKALFSNIFGANALNISPGPTIFGDAAEFGSLCSIYEDYMIDSDSGERVRYDSSAACGTNSPGLLQSRPLPKATVKRQALITRYCSNLVANTTAFNFVLKRISSETIPAGSSENILRLFRLFYRAHPDPHQSLVDSLLLMFSSINPSKDEWKPVIFGICASSQWQVL